MAKSQIALLINLAASDGQIDEKERTLIQRIGASHGFSEVEVEALIASPPEIKGLSDLDAEERFECLYGLVQLMKVDGQIFDEEIQYCMDMAKKLKFPLEAVMELYGLVHGNVKLPREINNLKNKYQDIRG